MIDLAKLVITATTDYIVYMCYTLLAVIVSYPVWSIKATPPPTISSLPLDSHPPALTLQHRKGGEGRAVSWPDAGMEYYYICLPLPQTASWGHFVHQTHRRRTGGTKSTSIPSIKTRLTAFNSLFSRTTNYIDNSAVHRCQRCWSECVPVKRARLFLRLQRMQPQMNKT